MPEHLSYVTAQVPMQNISTSVSDGMVHLDCSGFALCDDVITDNVSAVTELLAQLLLVEQTRSLLTDKTLRQRLTSIAAQDMIVEVSILNALNQARILLEITAGHSSIADFGFPEFQGDCAIDV